MSSMQQLRCNTTQRHKHEQQWREERDACFLVGNSHCFEFMSAKDENIMVRCTLCAGDKLWSSSKNMSNLQKHLDSQHSTVKFTHQVPPNKATASTSAGGPPPPKQQKLDFSAKQVSGGELKKLVGRYVVEEVLPLNTIDSPSFRAIINKLPSSINAVLGITVENALPIRWVLAKPVVLMYFMLRRRGVVGSCWM